MRNTPHTLILLRHAKSDYPAGVADHDRPLAPRGVREAALAGDWLRATLPTIDAVLCSTARRTRETLARTGIDAPVHYAERLYDATPGTVIAEINTAAEQASTLLVIGHEPAISQVALGLAGVEGTNRSAAERISVKFPTSAIAVLQVPCRWEQLEVGGARLIEFHIPR
ncbi:MAG TPA: histidine phosphatase family protein [Mycobacterium sp.]|nr:histidine phosphatase family protein [Mycobacterium sp.]